MVEAPQPPSLWAVFAYLAIASLWLLLQEIGRLQRYCEEAALYSPRDLVSAGQWLLLQPVIRGLQLWLNQEQRKQQLLQQRLDEISHSSHELEQSAALVTRNAEGQSDLWRHQHESGSRYDTTKFGSAYPCRSSVRQHPSRGMEKFD